MTTSNSSAGRFWELDGRLDPREIAAKLVGSEATVKTHGGLIFATLQLRDRVEVASACRDRLRTTLFAYWTVLCNASGASSPMALANAAGRSVTASSGWPWSVDAAVKNCGARRPCRVASTRTRR